MLWRVWKQSPLCFNGLQLKGVFLWYYCVSLLSSPWKISENCRCSGLSLGLPGAFTFLLVHAVFNKVLNFSLASPLEHCISRPFLHQSNLVGFYSWYSSFCLSYLGASGFLCFLLVWLFFILIPSESQKC